MMKPLGQLPKTIQAWCVVAVLLVGLVSVGPARSQTPWLRVAHTLFPGGFGQALGSDGKDLYVLRQFATNARVSFQRFGLDDGLVTGSFNLPPPPQALQNGTTMAFDPDGNLYALFGSEHGKRRRFFSRFTAGQWLALAPTPFDQGAGDAQTFVSFQGERFVYTVLGARAAFARYNLGPNRWETLPAPPWACSGNGSALAWDGGEFVYALQGSDCDNTPSRAFARYYLSLQLWETLPDVPEAVNYGGSLLWDGDVSLYATTGSDVPFAGRTLLRYDLEAQRWDASLPPLNCSVGEYNGNRLAAVAGRLYYWQGAPPTWNDTPLCDGKGLYLFAWKYVS